MPKLTDDEIVEMMSTGSVMRGPFSYGLTDFGLRVTALSRLTPAEHLQLSPMVEKLAAEIIARREPTS